MSKCECVRKREVSNYFKWKFKDMSIKEHIDMLIASGIGKKDAIKQAAQERGVSKRDVYNEYEKE